MSDTLQEREDQAWTHGGLDCADPGCPCHEWLKQQSAKEVVEHQPAARGGGDGGRMSADGDPKGYGDPVLCGSGTWRTDNGDGSYGYVWQGGALLATCVEPSRAQQIVREHNQHQSLVAERERLQQQNKRLFKALQSTAHNAADGSGLCWCAADDRVFGHQTKCMNLRRVINE